ncbi:uncharacterized protein TEOVI_000860600 [Trypanosoma equiperdum]|uniref:RIIa domain-containing protein n=4 Tax=Trypanozoon TaxID=39700 RepID=Q584I5_TRYB2|nr:hypothetical protein, conserved [Trypanosoma brucei gambiense DAL972]XP_844669.1 hypothetical protein, conserved [Trypanosoma brucei brucei TREU927]AAX80566.1 hypothetical protein, conserved [Trypanosoma brucei]RHW72979.1 hypothetical protein DPX39_040082800 [Trypanosoma brucei equiperdum]SCU66984.1 hypothetical protein, conserved [Trypanosoma equiperdum]AAZ11110.1 hypothetical protein, conserved [Trypanosoma brucei brucei TREU927]CBH10846.1 hypothetical protein, conserved [Trypanosoma bru|eukprot:XP_011773133.1 hypothetical protein, conserved [Trypanosoma brucei gambiense DAL972]
MSDSVRKKEFFDYESRVRIEKHAQQLNTNNKQYISRHPEITLVLHDILQHLLIHKPEDPLAAIQEYAIDRQPPARRAQLLKKEE